MTNWFVRVWFCFFLQEELLKKEHMHEMNEVMTLFEELLRQVNSYHLALAQMITSSEKAE